MAASDLKTARLTVLIDPSTKASFETACQKLDMTPSQVVRRLVRDFIEQRVGEARNSRAKSKKR